MHCQGGDQHDLRKVKFNDGIKPYGGGVEFGEKGYSEAAKQKVLPYMSQYLGIYDEMYLQCAAYAKTADTIYDRNIEATYILRLDKDVGEYQSIRSSLHDEYFDIFIHALSLYNGLNKIKSLIKSDRA